MIRAALKRLARAFRRAAVPLAWYYAITIVLPLANGAASAGATFVEHAFVVLIVPPVAISMMSAGVSAVAWARQRRADVRSSGLARQRTWWSRRVRLQQHSPHVVAASTAKGGSR